ncbi:hypothetical protein [Sporosarcina sp. FA9]|uniref:hypothetical protein n=1 Tax=Sporosarcina sp. FA9 TaxID=3413030 RepID=UPI003F65D349
MIIVIKDGYNKIKKRGDILKYNKADSRNDQPDGKQWGALFATLVLIGAVIVVGLIS